MSTKQASGESTQLYLIAVLGFVLVATMQVTNMILARDLAGTVPPFTLAVFRWLIIAAGARPVWTAPGWATNATALPR